MKEIIVTEKNAGGRLDKLIFRYLDKASQGFVYKMLRKKNITLNDHKASGSEILNAGDSVKLYLSDETVAKFKSGLSVREAANRAESGKKAVSVTKGPVKNTGVRISLSGMIVFEDDNILAVNKTAGLLSQKARPEDMSVNDFILEHVPQDEYFTPGIANRLDRNTSGIILAGRNLNAQRELSRAVAERSISKIYLTVVKGKIEQGGTREAWLVKENDSNTVTIFGEEKSGADRIVTAFEPLCSTGDETFLKVDLITGKPHQIRAHMAFLGHPVAGDAKYGDPEFNKYFKDRYGLKFQLLHAAEIGFISMQGILEYLNGKVITAPQPAHFRKILEGEGLWQPGAQED